MTVDFDTLLDGTPFVAPALFSAAPPLREQFAAAGVHFSRDAGQPGGGAVLLGSGFAVSGYSSPNVLAFNNRASALLSDGSPALGPEIIRFDQRPNLVRLHVASSDVGPAVLTALNADGGVVTTAQVTLSSSVGVLEVQSANYDIAAVKFEFLAPVRSVVVDNLVFVLPDETNVPPVTECSLAGDAGANGWYLGDVTATLTASDEDGQVVATQWRLGGGEWQPYSAPVVVSGEGTHTFEFQSLDEDGAWEDVKTWIIKIDTTAPVVDLRLSRWVLWPPRGQMEPVVVNGSCSDVCLPNVPVVFQVKDEYGVVQPPLTAFGQTIKLQAKVKPRDRDGRWYQVIATATDHAGRETSVTRWVFVPHNLNHCRRLLRQLAPCKVVRRLNR